jgi:maleylacetoacetate isomerase
MLKLYSYWRSSAAYRVRIGLNLKSLAHEIVPVHLVRDGGRQFSDEYRRLNPQGFVPTLVDGEVIISQSIAILAYLEEKYGGTPLLPTDPAQRALGRQIALTVACDIHPLNNQSVLRYLAGELGVDEAGKNAWYRHWIGRGFDAIETLLRERGRAGPFCLGDAPGLADICLVPQIYNARRFNVPLDAYPTLRAIEEHCLKLEAFDRARPESQPDAEP